MGDFDAGDALRALEQMRARVENATKTATQEGAQAIVAQAQGNAPVETGALRRSIYADGVESRGGGTWVSNMAPHVVYARIIELGGVITAHGDYPLHRPGTDRYFGHSVTVVPRPYFAPALREAAPKVLSIATRLWGAAMGG